MKLDIPRVLVPLRLGEVCPKLKKALSPLFPTLIKLDIPRVLVPLRLGEVCPKFKNSTVPLLSNVDKARYTKGFSVLETKGGLSQEKQLFFYKLYHNFSFFKNYDRIKNEIRKELNYGSKKQNIRGI